jgi:hypothetical protein
MASWKSVLAVVAFVGIAQPVRGEDNAPEANRKLMANILEAALAKEAMTAKLDKVVSERHKEEVKLNPKLPAIVTYWRSEVAVKAACVEPETKLKIEVPKMVREKDKITLQVTGSAPVSGDVTGRALTDDMKEFLKVPSEFTTTVTATAECVLTRVVEKDQVKIQIVIKEWKPVLKDTKFKNTIADKLRDPIQNAMNKKLLEMTEPLREKANEALKKAYDEGKLKFDP